MDRMWNKLTIGLLTGSALSSFSVWIDFLVILTLTSYTYHANAFLMAFVSALILGPSVFLGQMVGRLVDSHNNHSLVLIWSLVLRTIITMLILLKPSFLFFCLIVFIRSVISLPENPASNVISTQILSPHDISRYFGLLGLLRSVSKIAAPTLGVLIASNYGESVAIKISILMTLLASISIVYAFHKYKYHDAHNSKNNHKEEETVPSINKISYTEENRNTNHHTLKQLLWTVTTYSFMVFFINSA